MNMYRKVDADHRNFRCATCGCVFGMTRQQIEESQKSYKLTGDWRGMQCPRCGSGDTYDRGF